MQPLVLLMMRFSTNHTGGGPIVYENIYCFCTILAADAGGKFFFTDGESFLISFSLSPIKMGAQ